MMEIKTEPNESYELNVDGENENMVDNNSMESVSVGKMHLYFFLNMLNTTFTVNFRLMFF